MAKKASIGDAIETFLRKEFPNLSDMSEGYPKAKARVAMKAAKRLAPIKTSAGANAARNRTKAAAARAAANKKK